MHNNDIFSLNGHLATVGNLQKDIYRFLANFEERFYEEESEIFDPDIQEIYNQNNVCLVPFQDSDTGLSCKLLNCQSQAWVEGEFMMRPILKFQYLEDCGYQIDQIDYDQHTLVKIGSNTFDLSDLLASFIQYFRSNEENIVKTVSESLAKHLSHTSKNLFNPATADRCLTVQVLQPGQGWKNCQLDLTLMLRLYTLQNPIQLPQLIYQEDDKLSKIALSQDSILQFGTHLILVKELSDKIQNKFKHFEYLAKDNTAYYEDTNILSNDLVRGTHEQEKVYFSASEKSEKGFPCRLLQLKTGQWLDGELKVELVPYFVSDALETSANVKVGATQAPSTVESILDDIRQTMNQNPQ